MPFPAARYAVPHVGSAGGQGSGGFPCANTQVGGLLRRGQPEQRKVRSLFVRHIQRANLRRIPETTPAPSLARQKDGARLGQRPLSPRQTARSFIAAASKAPDAAVLAALLSTTRSDRTSVETGTPVGDAQSLFRHSQRSPARSGILLRPLAKTEPGPTTAMRHHLRRYVYICDPSMIAAHETSR